MIIGERVIANLKKLGWTDERRLENGSTWIEIYKDEYCVTACGDYRIEITDGEAVYFIFYEDPPDRWKHALWSKNIDPEIIKDILSSVDFVAKLKAFT